MKKSYPRLCLLIKQLEIIIKRLKNKRQITYEDGIFEEVSVILFTYIMGKIDLREI